jgi:hypothetical protein
VNRSGGTRLINRHHARGQRTHLDAQVRRSSVELYLTQSVIISGTQWYSPDERVRRLSVELNLTTPASSSTTGSTFPPGCSSLTSPSLVSFEKSMWPSLLGYASSLFSGVIWKASQLTKPTNPSRQLEAQQLISRNPSQSAAAISGAHLTNPSRQLQSSWRRYEPMKVRMSCVFAPGTPRTSSDVSDSLRLSETASSYLMRGALKGDEGRNQR